MFLAVVTEKDLELLQFNVQTAFLYDDLEESIFVKIPEGLDIEDERRKSGAANIVYKLEKLLYGLKQTPRCWNRRFTRFLSQFDLKAVRLIRVFSSV